MTRVLTVALALGILFPALVKATDNKPKTSSFTRIAACVPDGGSCSSDKDCCQGGCNSTDHKCGKK